MKLTEKQKLFVNEYIKSRNAEQAAIEAGYSPKTARGHAHKLLQNVAIKKLIDERLKAVDDLDIFNGDAIIRELLSIGFGKSYDEIPILVGEGVQDVVQVRTPDSTRRAALNDAYKLVKASGRDELLTRKLELEIEKLEKDLQTETSTEDKLAELIKQNREVLGHD